MSATAAVSDEERLSERGFARLLEWLDDGVDSQGEAYLEVRRRLVAYFDRRNRPSAEALADETLTRVAMTLETATVAIAPPLRYCYALARFVLLEDLRHERKHVRFDGEPPSLVAAAATRQGEHDADDGRDLTERRLTGLDRCLQQLTPERRALVLDYYRDTGAQTIQRRRDLAARLGVSMNALAIRACRIRARLEQCVATADHRRI